MCPKKREKKVACQQSLVKAPAVGRTGGPHGVLYPIFLQRQTLQLAASTESLEFRHAVAWLSRGSCSATVGLRMPRKAQVMHGKNHCPRTSTVSL